MTSISISGPHVIRPRRLHPQLVSGATDGSFFEPDRFSQVVGPPDSQSSRGRLPCERMYLASGAIAAARMRSMLEAAATPSAVAVLHPCELAAPRCETDGSRSLSKLSRRRTTTRLRGSSSMSTR